MSDSESKTAVGGGGPRVRPPHEELLQRAVDDRAAHPWRYYRLEHDVMKRLLDEQAAQLADLRGERDEWKLLADQRGLLLDVLEAPAKNYNRTLARAERAEADLTALRAERDALQQQVVAADSPFLTSAMTSDYSGNVASLTAAQQPTVREAQLEADLARLRSRGQALVQQWMEEVERDETLARANAASHPELAQHLYVRATERKACADALTAALTDEPLSGE